MQSIPLLRAAAAVLLVPCALAQGPPAGYYDTVDTTNATTLRATLHDVIDDHTRYPYTSSSTDTWDILELAQQDPNNSNNILDCYQNDSHPKQGGGNDFYNREHVWPRSYGIPDDVSSNYPFTDCHMLMLCDPSHNSSRSNKPFRNCNASCSERTTVFNNGQGGGSGSYPGNSNWTSGSFTQGTWEVWNGRRGDIARAILYFDVRYEGGTHGVTGHNEPDLIATDSEALIDASNTGSNESVAYMGMLSVLLQWHAQDPPDDFERNANDVVFSFQGNRNPFVDHPEWVDCIWGGGSCSTSGAPGTAYCFGVGCPCGNDDPSAGCANSTGAGAALVGTGTNSVSADDLVLTAFAVPQFNNGLFYMGDAQVQNTFFDGFQCALGTTFRYLGSIQSSGVFGSLTYTGFVADAGGLITAGSTWNFHAWFRDVPGTPCGTGANLTHGYSVTFAP